MIPVTWRFHPDNELHTNFKVFAYRNRKYLDWLKTDQKCWSCPSKGNSGWNPMTPSHIFRSFHGMKNHDWGAIPQCLQCHDEMEYHRSKFDERYGLPTAEDAEKYFQKFLKSTDTKDDRKPNQLVPL